MKPVEAKKILVLVGAGGHAKVLLSLAKSAGFKVIGVCAPEFESQEIKEWRGVKVLGGDSLIEQLDPADTGLINGVGHVMHNSVRKIIFERYRTKGFDFPALVHPFSYVDSSVSLGQGVQVMAGAVIQADSVIGENTIINSRASIDHDCIIDANVHIAPGVVVCGNSTIGGGAIIGAGATIIQSLVVGQNAVVGAGSVLARSLPANCMSLGIRPQVTQRQQN